VPSLACHGLPATPFADARPRAPRRGWVIFAALLALQVAGSMHAPNPWRLQSSAGIPPSRVAVRLASLDESELAGYATALYAQEFDAQAGAWLPLRASDFTALRAWLELSFALHPRSGYPLMLAAFDYAETAHRQDETTRPDMPAAPALLDFVRRGYAADPSAHWRWLAHAAWVARYVVHDDAWAAAAARALRDAPAGAAIPRWARELDSYVLQSKDGQEGRRALLGALAAGSGNIDPQEFARLSARLAPPSAPGPAAEVENQGVFRAHFSPPARGASAQTEH
jgi:hypothetical protein